ncbi:hypothetical protein OG921_24100 [Aldersonia sp. NBC_00410]|uniref:hypothetical protein n=1 Tax=Aldersonia sp. NBC_00410 TaxID=2975954 RepID=UPI002258F64B|nr:hypothetical protein [Aldersonia sp. NBC_00410]MCX5046258.1 hypothetical protein [Aldersonia sp. NBC_00410]
MTATVHQLRDDETKVRKFVRDLRKSLNDLFDAPLDEELAAEVVDLLVREAPAIRDACGRVSDPRLDPNRPIPDGH